MKKPKDAAECARLLSALRAELLMAMHELRVSHYRENQLREAGFMLLPHIGKSNKAKLALENWKRAASIGQ